MGADKPVLQVLYALPSRQVIAEIPLDAGMTAADAVRLSGLAERFPEIERSPLVLGNWGVAVDVDYAVRAGDRIEISRPLIADPRDMRRELISDGRVMGGAQERGSSVRSRSIRDT